MVFDTLPYANDIMVKDFQKGLTWFRVNNPEAYYVLLDQLDIARIPMHGL